jgi:hypothetical protein
MESDYQNFEIFWKNIFRKFNFFKIFDFYKTTLHHVILIKCNFDTLYFSSRFFF